MIEQVLISDDDDDDDQFVFNILCPTTVLWLRVWDWNKLDSKQQHGLESTKLYSELPTDCTEHACFLSCGSGAKRSHQRLWGQQHGAAAAAEDVEC